MESELVAMTNDTLRYPTQQKTVIRLCPSLGKCVGKENEGKCSFEILKPRELTTPRGG